jgi:hypothetical protein
MVVERGDIICIAQENAVRGVAPVAVAVDKDVIKIWQQCLGH